MSTISSNVLQHLGEINIGNPKKETKICFTSNINNDNYDNSVTLLCVTTEEYSLWTFNKYNNNFRQIFYEKFESQANEVCNVISSNLGSSSINVFFIALHYTKIINDNLSSW